MPQESIESLEAHRDRSGGKAGNGNYGFCHSDGSPPDPDLVTLAFKRMAKKAGLGELGLHDLRHTHASLMLSKGIYPKIVSERLGHSTIGKAIDLHPHVIPSIQIEAVRQFGTEWREGNGKFQLGEPESSKFVSGEWMGPGGPCGLQNRYASLVAG